MNRGNGWRQKGVKLTVALALLTGLTLATNNRAGATSVLFAGGSGTVSDPYVIETAVQLNEMRNYTSAYFVLGADIDLSTSAYSAGWTPIVTFNGQLDGEGHTISGIKVVGTGSYKGLIGETGSSAVIADLTIADSQVTNGSNATTAVVVAKNAGTIENVTVVDSTVSGGAFTGLLAGSNTGMLKGNQVIRGSVSGGQDSGGLLGINFGTVERNRVYDTTVAGANGVGGLMGDNQAAGGVVKWSSYVAVTADVTGTSDIGGLVGENGGQLQTSYARGTVGKTTAGMIVGGLVGLNSGTIEDAYASGAVRGTSTVGGLVGYQMSGGKVARAYASAAMTPSGSGALVGQAAGEVSNSFWNSALASGSALGSGTASGNGATSLTGTQMLQKSSFTAAGWDFTDKWQIDEGVSAPTPLSLLDDVQLTAEGDPVELHFTSYRYQYTVNVPAGTQVVGMTAVKTLADDSVQIDSAPVDVLSKTFTLSSDPQSFPIKVTRGSKVLTYTLTIQGSGAAQAPVDRSALSSAVSSAGSVLAGAVVGNGDGQYTTAAAATLSAAIAAATETLTDPGATQSALDAAVTALEAAVTVFEGSVVTVDRSALSAAIGAAGEALTDVAVGSGEGEYPAEALVALTMAVNEAASVFVQPAVTQSALDAAVTALNDAVTAFASSAVTVDRAALTAAIAAASGVLSGAVIGTDPGQHPPADAAALSAAIASATAVSAKPAVTQGELDGAAAALGAALTVFQGGVVTPDRSVLAAALAAAGGALTAAEEGSGAGQHEAADLAALTAAITAAAQVYAKPDAAQGELTAAAAALDAAVSAFRSAMHGAVLLFAEETMDGSKHVLMLTYDHPLQSAGSTDAFVVSAGGVAVVGAMIDSDDNTKVRLFLSAALPTTGGVTVTAVGPAVVLANGASNTAASNAYVLTAGAASQLRQELLNGDTSTGGSIQISHVAQYVGAHLASADRHGIAERDWLQYCLRQIQPLFLTNPPAGG